MKSKSSVTGRSAARRIVPLASIFFLVFAPRLFATTLARMSLSQMARAADIIVRVRCVTATSGWAQGSIWTVTEFDVLEKFKGSPESRIQVRLPGGRVGHIQMNVEAAPRFRPGEEGVLFLEKTGAGDYSVTAWAQGTFRIGGNAQSGQATVTQDSSAWPCSTALRTNSATKEFAIYRWRNFASGYPARWRQET